MRLQIRSTLVLVCPFALAACLGTADQVRIMQQYDAISATPSTTPDYDYSVLLGNLRPLGVSTELKVDRERLAVAYLGSRCPKGRIVSETELATRSPGLSAGSKDYAVRLKC